MQFDCLFLYRWACASIAGVVFSFSVTPALAQDRQPEDTILEVLETLGADPEAIAAALVRLAELEAELSVRLDILDDERDELEARIEALRVGRELVESISPPTIAQDDSSETFWSFRPLARSTPPTVRDEEWSRNEIDRFILRDLEAKTLAPAPEASRRSLVRRVYFDLIGLPPTPEEMDEHLADDSAGAYEELIDRLLASPHYGERWGRHWLDVARYADSAGYEFDVERPTAYPYRDFVIRAFNDDMPFDQFVRWQLAGDEYEPDNPLAIAATGFCTSGPNVNNQETELNRYNELDDMLSTTSAAFLGLTMECARCHDHKYDPIPSRDYYRMLSAFNSSKRHDALLTTRAKRDAYRAEEKAWNKELNGVKKSRGKFLAPFREEVRLGKIDALELKEEDKALLRAKRDKDNNEQVVLLATFGKQIEAKDGDVRGVLGLDELLTWSIYRQDEKEIEDRKPASPPKALALTDSKPEPKENFFLTRGNPETKGEALTLGFLTALPGADSPKFSPAAFQREDGETTFQRMALAEWITDVDDGAGRLVARVIANRLWLYHFGRGIVGTPSDFGMQGDRPTHPELLDWLASELPERSWSLKEMHKLILMSATYRMSTEFDTNKAEIDPGNRLWWRREPIRHEAEVIRDAILASSGSLNTKMYGPGIHPFMHPDAIATGSTDKWPVDVVDGPETWRRSVYIYIRRSVLMPMMEAFDAPDTTASCARRNTTTVPSQALALMNSPFLHDQSERLAARVRGEIDAGLGERVDRVFRLTLSRAPRADELRASVKYIEQTSEARGSSDEAFTDFCQVMLNLNEFVYVN